MKISIPSLKITALIIVSSLCVAASVDGANPDMERFMPAPACDEGWTMDGKVTFFDKDTLFDRINGESELYFPYGFDLLAYARYVNKQNPEIAVDADIYRMGSLLDAFGMFANYRKKNDADVVIGAGGTVSSSQLFFYQDRYFVRLQVTGTTSVGQEIFLSCARTISQKLPQTTSRPKELEVLMVPSVVKKSERYVAQSLMGYSFFRRGLVADALLNHTQVQVFIVIESSREGARKAFDQYVSYLETEGSDTRVIRAQGQISLEAIDPLYGKVLAEQEGRFVIGVVRVADPPAAKRLVEKLRTRLSEKP